MGGAVGEVLKDFFRAVVAHGVFGAAVAEGADDLIDFGLFAEAFDSGGNDEEFALVGHCHAGAIDGFVCHPGCTEFVRLHDGNDFFDGAVEDRDVLFAAGAGG